MAKEIFYVKVETAKTATVHAFSRSETGILDYAGTTTPQTAELSQMQNVEGSAYFTPSWYTFLPTNLQAEISVFLPASIENLDANQYSFLLHVGALLLAVQEKDGLLAAELLHRRSMVFANFTPILQHILKPVAAEALFAFVYGGFRGESNFQRIYANNAPISTGETDAAAILFAAARDTLKPNSERESAEAMFIRYFSENENRHFDFTIGLVGASNHPWLAGINKFKNLSDTATGFHFTNAPNAVGQKYQDVFASLKTKVQAEPYNPHDHNAISVSIEDLTAIIKGFRSKAKAGYLRANGAAILRKARPNLYGYESTLWRIGGNPDYFENAIVLRLKF